jgi:hypothetical protein
MLRFLILLEAVTPPRPLTKASVIIKISGAGVLMITICYDFSIRIVVRIAGWEPVCPSNGVTVSAIFLYWVVLASHLIWRMRRFKKSNYIGFDFVLSDGFKFFFTTVVFWVKGTFCILNVFGVLISQAL